LDAVVMPDRAPPGAQGADRDGRRRWGVPAACAPGGARSGPGSFGIPRRWSV